METTMAVHFLKPTDRDIGYAAQELTRLARKAELTRWWDAAALFSHLNQGNHLLTLWEVRPLDRSNDLGNFRLPCEWIHILGSVNIRLESYAHGIRAILEHLFADGNTLQMEQSPFTHLLQYLLMTQPIGQPIDLTCCREVQIRLRPNQIGLMIAFQQLFNLTREQCHFQEPDTFIFTPC